MTNWIPVEPLSDEPQDQAYWEPWTPAIGDRVRVRLSGECQFETVGAKHGVLSERTPTHRKWEDGKTGTVIVCRYIARDGYCSHATDGRGHRIVVQFDAIEDREGILTDAGHYAAVELEPLE